MKKVYVIKCANYFKIGISGQPNRRLKDLQTSNPLPLQLVAISTEFDPEELEKHLHNHFSSVNSSGEWFELKESHLKELRIDYHFDFKVSIPKIISNSHVPKTLLESTKIIRSLNIEYDEVVNYFNELYCSDIHEANKLKRAVKNYGKEIVIEAIDILYRIHDDYQDAYNKIPKMCKSAHLKKTNPAQYFCNYVCGIFYNKFSDPIKVNEKEFLINFYNLVYFKYDISDLCKWLRYTANEFSDSVEFWNYLRDKDAVQSLKLAV